MHKNYYKQEVCVKRYTNNSIRSAGDQIQIAWKSFVTVFYFTWFEKKNAQCRCCVY